MYAPDRHPAEAVIDRALVPFERQPAQEDIAATVADLITHGQALLPNAETLRESNRKVEGACRDWHALTTHGPADHPLGNWSYCRGLARVVRTFLQASEGTLPEHVPTPVSDLPLMSFSRFPTS
ncbi:DUF6415 family natural product biosynthesis protein [Streptomyces bambusae]|uniref:DUF6415 family natural product biosynthesis protein n=1 Tax=Streptomyces bambusae TaxID=1550616 RepID=UPI001CFFD1D9|nr:DUF6415 family natural product biosynthesis protein [Streptomyces bambusae]MCB5170129.1 DUF6415 family natural product biosynthesis protein [Streptomyces bambusae]